MKAWQIDDPTTYKYVKGLQNAIREYFQRRNDELSHFDETQAIIERCENTRAWAAITDIMYGDIDVTTGGINNENVN